MKQPDLGQKIAELRQQKGLTQEKLAEYCEVSTRTIQRIEKGDVEPRSFTLNSLSNILAWDFGKESTDFEALWLALIHCSSIVCFILFPLVFWLGKKNESSKINQQGRAALNFQITVLLILLSLALAVLVLPTLLMMLHLPLSASSTLWGIAPVLILLISLFTLCQGIMNMYRSMTDKPVHYALSIPFLK